MLDDGIRRRYLILRACHVQANIDDYQPNYLISRLQCATASDQIASRNEPFFFNCNKKKSENLLASCLVGV